MFSSIGAYFRDLVSGVGQAWNEFWFERADGATLGLIRLGAGLIALYFAATYSFDLERFLGPDGLLPASTVTEWRSGAENQWWRISYFNFVQGRGDLWATHIVSLVVLLLMTVGLFSRVTTVLSLIVVLAYCNRAPMLTGELEPVLCMVLFYLCFGPSGAAFSIDAWRANRRRAALSPAERAQVPAVALTYGANIAQRLMQLHVALIYVLMSIAKLWGDTWIGGEAIWWLATRPDSRMVDLTHTLANWPNLVDFWTYLVLLSEMTFAVLIWNRLARPLVLLGSTLSWISLMLVTGDVPWASLMIVANLAFVSGEATRQALTGWSFRSRTADTPAAATR